MSKFITKEIRLDNLLLPDGVTIQYSKWTISKNDITFAEDNIVFYIDKDYANLTSKVFSNLFEVGIVYYVKLRLIYSTGASIETQPLKVLVSDDTSIYTLYPIPAVVVSPEITLDHTLTRVPKNNINATTTAFNVKGNALHEYTDWWLTDDANTVIWSRLEDRYNLTSILIEDVLLSSDKMYTLYAAHMGSNNDLSSPGSITFRPYSYTELELNTDLTNIYYEYGISATLVSVPNTLVSFQYELLGDGVIVVASDTNSTGIINTGVLSETYDYFMLKTKVNIGGVTYGWIYDKVVPKKWDVISTVNTSSGLIYKKEIANFPITGIKGDTLGFNKSFQFPNGDIMLKTRNDTFSIYRFNEITKRFTFINDFILPDRTSLDTGESNALRAFYCKPLAGFKIMMILDYGVSTLKVHIYDYNPGTGTMSIYWKLDMGEMGYALGAILNDAYVQSNGNVIISMYARHVGGLLTDTPTKNTQVYKLDITNKTNTLLIEGIDASYIGKSFLQQTNTTFLLFGGWLNTNESTASTKIHKLDITSTPIVTDVTSSSTILTKATTGLTISSKRNFTTVKLMNGNSLFFYPWKSLNPTGTIRLDQIDTASLIPVDTPLYLDKHTSDITGVIHLSSGAILLIENNLKTAYYYE